MTGAKQELRKILRKQLAELPPELFRGEGNRAAKFMARFPAWENAPAVLLFLSAPGEIETTPLLNLAFKQGKKVFLPKVEGETARFFRAASAAGPWRTGAFGIREPVTDGPEPPEEFPSPSAWEGNPVLMAVPGMAFDRQGNRMGHGKGYYDRFFAKLEGLNIPCVKAAFCLEQQILPQVPTETWDKRMDAVCTGTGLFVIL
jgi:5-formyltetrahydrofolate cyclo-ligase